MLSDRHTHERGQTVPFWVFALITSLALSLFIMNYTNTVRWHIRAQNAADAAAMTALAGEASLMNQRTIVEYAAALDEYRLRSIIYSMINAANGVGADTTQSTSEDVTKTCNPSVAMDDTGIDCDNAYDQEPYFYDQAIAQYALAIQALEKLNKPSPPPSVTPAPSSSNTPAPLPSAPPGSTAAAAFSLVQSDQYCWDQASSPRTPAVFDCGFYYNADLSHTGPGSTETVDVVACRSVTPAARFFYMGGLLGAQFNAVGRAAATLKAVTETFTPGSTSSGATDPNNSGLPFQPSENCPPSNGPTGGSCNPMIGWMDSPSYTVDYGQTQGSTYGLKVQVTFYVPVLTTPLSNPSWMTQGLACKKG